MKSKGFTLIELLVVIAIIGILSTILMANFMGVRERARDATRKSDFNQIQKALELYKNTTNPPSYPPTASWRALLQDPNSDGDTSDALMQKIPYDPLCPNGDPSCTYPDYAYQFNPSGGGSLTYKLVACLENSADQQSDLNLTGVKDGLCLTQKR